MRLPKIPLAALALCLAASAAHARQDTWPERPVTVIVPFAPGGATDVMARMLGPKIEETLG